MKRVRKDICTPHRQIKTPHKRFKVHEEPKEKIQDPVEVYCRLRPLPNTEDSMCINLISPTTIRLTPSDYTRNRKVLQYGFKHVFTSHATQKEIFNTVALPLLDGLLHGKNGLLFTYGVTGSGKTYTMTGEQNDPGLMPRCINTLFNTIYDHQTPKYLIKSNKMNGFEMQMPGDAINDRLQETKAKHKAPKHKLDTIDNINYSNDGLNLNNIQENCLFSVFVHYIEIYNNTVYDLLDDFPGAKLQPKILREGSYGMYVNGVRELEVKSAEEAFELFKIGQKRKRMAHTIMNSESSRSHSIFTIRLVQGVFDTTEQLSTTSDTLVVSQLSLVDLAGSERCNRAQTTGQRLKEAGSINNSLMSLRTCLEILRENQMQGSNKIVPYRDSRLTFLFKNHFDGEGKVEMIVCVNPSFHDYDETIQVMKFAEITQEVKIVRPESKDNILQEIIAKKNAEKENIVDIEYFPLKKRSRLDFQQFNHLSEDQRISSLYNYLKLELRRCKDKRIELTKKRNAFRQELINKLENNKQSLIEKNSLTNILQNSNELVKECFAIKAEFNRALKDSEIKSTIIEEIKKTKQVKALELNQNIIQQEEETRKLEERIKYKYEMRLEKHKNIITSEIQKEAAKFELIKNIINDQPVEEIVPYDSPDFILKDKKKHVYKGPTSTITKPSSQTNQDDDIQTCISTSPKKRVTPASNVRFRHPTPVTQMWLEHKPLQPLPLETVFQPHMPYRKSVSKLTSVKDVTGEMTKYVLYNHEKDEAGDIETKLYKGDIIHTNTGGAQVVFDDVEKLKHVLPTSGNVKKTSEF